jgi:hypothetical protein
VNWSVNVTNTKKTENVSPAAKLTEKNVLLVIAKLA